MGFFWVSRGSVANTIGVFAPPLGTPPSPGQRKILTPKKLEKKEMGNTDKNLTSGSPKMGETTNKQTNKQPDLAQETVFGLLGESCIPAGLEKYYRQYSMNVNKTQTLVRNVSSTLETNGCGFFWILSTTLCRIKQTKQGSYSWGCTLRFPTPDPGGRGGSGEPWSTCPPPLRNPHRSYHCSYTAAMWAK